MHDHWMQDWFDRYGAVPIPSRCPIEGIVDCIGSGCRYHHPYKDLARHRTGLCSHPDAVEAAVDSRQRELDFHVATNTLDWHRAGQLALKALNDSNLTEGALDVWRERFDAVRRGIAGG